jgi:hypothetical protein
MDYAAFRNKYLGTKNDYDGKFGYQCVDLVKLWAREGWKLQPKAVGHSKGYAKFVFQYNDSMLTSEQAVRIANQPKLVPPQGAIIVFDSAKKNAAGHIAIVDKANLNEITVLEQNGGSGNGDGQGTNAIRLKTYSYGSNGSGVGAVLGWLVPKKGAPNGGSGKITDRAFV